MPDERGRDSPHRRLNPLTGDWVLVSPQRSLRPWKGARSRAVEGDRPSHDPECHLCPGNRRASGEVNPPYTGTYVFANDFPALIDEQGGPEPLDAGLLHSRPARGACRVLCFSPRHDLSLAEMTPPEIRAVIDAWTEQTEELGRTFRSVQVFENKGEMMGCSDPHPHGQIWATDGLPREPAAEDRNLRVYLAEHARPLLHDYLEQELSSGERLVVEDSDWVVVVPFWAVWPYETLLLPRRSAPRMTDLTEDERDSLARCLARLLVRYDNLFETPFPYSMGWHGAPHGDSDESHWTLHAHFYPPLLRSATVRKFMVGYEMLAEPQRDLTAEAAAARLRALPEVHYRQRRPADG
jgi:UDPglucose--hexose-1-phosphate uridylyltransferase